MWKGAQNLTFSWNLRVGFSRNITLWAMRDLYMLSKAPLIILIHFRTVTKHPSSNQCLFLQRSIPLPMLIWCLKSNIFHEIWGRCVGQNDTVWTIRGLHMLSNTHWFILIHLRNNMKHSRSNGCLFLQPSIPCPMLKGCPKSNMFIELWEWCFGRNYTVWTIRGLFVLSKSFSIILIHWRNNMKHPSNNGRLPS